MKPENENAWKKASTICGALEKKFGCKTNLRMIENDFFAYVEIGVVPSDGKQAFDATYSVEFLDDPKTDTQTKAKTIAGDIAAALGIEYHG